MTNYAGETESLPHLASVVGLLSRQASRDHREDGAVVVRVRDDGADGSDDAAGQHVAVVVPVVGGARDRHPRGHERRDEAQQQLERREGVDPDRLAPIREVDPRTAQQVELDRYTSSARALLLDNDSVSSAPTVSTSMEDHASDEWPDGKLWRASFSPCASVHRLATPSQTTSYCQPHMS